MTPAINYRILKGREFTPFFSEVAALRIEVFRDFPYLYDGDESYERDYLRLYAESKDSLIVLVNANGRIVGASTALPMRDADPEFAEPLTNAGYDMESLFYFGESVVLRPYRGCGIGKKFFELRETHALSFARVTTTCFAAVVRDIAHPSCPFDYRPLDGFWQGLGYNKVNDVTARFAWLDVGHSAPNEKEMAYWVKTHR